MLLVIVLHGLGLQTLSTYMAWPRMSEPPLVAHVRLSAPAPVATDLIPLFAPRQTSAPKVAKVVAPTLSANNATAPSDVTDTPTRPSTTQADAATRPSVPEPVTPAANSAPPSLPAETPIAAESLAPTPPPPSAPPVVAPVSWLGKAQFVWPMPALLQFDLSGTSKGVRYTANASIRWQHQDNNYQLRHDIQAFLFGTRSQTSAGQLDAAGLLPTRFGDQFRQEQAAHFDRTKGLLIYSANTPSQPLEEGAQDRLSLFFQMAGAMAGTPSLRSAGQQLSMQVVSAKQAEAWTFKVMGPDTLSTPLGALDSLHLHRVPRNDYDQKIDIWLSPAHGYVPARIRITQANGDVIEETLKSVGKP